MMITWIMAQIQGFRRRQQSIGCLLLWMIVSRGASGFATLDRSSSLRSSFVPILASENETNNASFNWVEEWALEGKEAVALMKVQERTQRVMLAQKTEDRIFEITKILDSMVQPQTDDDDGGAIPEDQLERAKELALETRNLQKEYKDLVTGAPSALLETFRNLKVVSEDDDDDNNNNNNAME